MSDPQATLYLICGKIAAGKSTLAHQLAAAPDCVLLSEDKWLSGLYPQEITTLEDYVRCSSRLRQLIGPHTRALLQTGLSVVMDFPANTLNNRAWMRDIVEDTKAANELHFLDLTDEVCKARLKQRNEDGEHPYQTNEEEFDLVTSYFVAPTAAEGFTIITHTAD